MAPGFDFILGKQPDEAWLDNAARRGLITRDTLFNDLIRQTFDQRVALSAQLEPFRDFTIDLNVDKTFNKNFIQAFNSAKPIVRDAPVWFW